MIMESSVPGRLAGWEFHGFLTMEDLNIEKLMKEATTRWLRPHEVYAILCNHTCFNIHIKPVQLPKGGTIVLYDRKMLRNFRKDGHNWKKKKDGKSVQEAHEHLKVGNQERVHVYYAHAQDIPNFARRCYWLLDKKHEHIVLVHYRDVLELQGSPVTPVNSKSYPSYSDTPVSKLQGSPVTPVNPNSYPSYSDTPVSKLQGSPITPVNSKSYPSYSDTPVSKLQGSPITPVNSNSYPSYSNTPVSKVLSEETNSGSDPSLFGEPIEIDDDMTVRNHEMRLHEINTLEWEDLLAENDPDESRAPYTDFCFKQQNGCEISNSGNNGTLHSSYSTIPGLMPSFELFTTVSSLPIDLKLPTSTYPQAMSSTVQSEDFENATSGTYEPSTVLVEGSLQTQDSFDRWMDNIIVDSPVTSDNFLDDFSFSTCHESSTSMIMDHQQNSIRGQVICITDVAPAWAYSTKETKVIVIGYFHGEYSHLAESSLFCVFGDVCVPAENVQKGVFRCMTLPHTSGFVNFYLSFDGYTPISQVMTFEYRPSLNEKPNLEEYQVQLRLARLLSSTTNNLNILSSKLTSSSLKVAKEFSLISSSIDKDWQYLTDSIEKREISFEQAEKSLFELTLKRNLKEWLLKRVVEECTTSIRDDQGQGVIHMCSILGYTWAIQLYSRLGLLLDFRDAFGWTALHWASFYGRKEMVAVLLLEGADPSLVTDPTSDFPGGCTAADIAAKRSHDGLAAYLAEKGLTAHFKLMSLSGNISGSLKTDESYLVNLDNLSEEQLCLKDTLAAYNTVADAASRIHAAFLGKSLMQQTEEIHHTEPEVEACSIIAAMKIQHAFRNYEIRKKMKAAARIQHRFRTWKIRKDFLNMRRRAIEIQAAFRGHKTRKQYQKIIWSVGVLEKAILRWRQKRKGFRGLQPQIEEFIAVEQKEENDIQEDFYQVSRKQAVDRIERAVIRVQALFRSYRAQQEYRKMKLTYDQAKSEYHLRSGLEPSNITNR